MFFFLGASEVYNRTIIRSRQRPGRAVRCTLLISRDPICIHQSTSYTRAQIDDGRRVRIIPGCYLNTFFFFFKHNFFSPRPVLYVSTKKKPPRRVCRDFVLQKKKFDVSTNIHIIYNGLFGHKTHCSSTTTTSAVR